MTRLFFFGLVYNEPMSLRAGAVFLSCGAVLGVAVALMWLLTWCAPAELGTSLWMNKDTVSDGYLLVSPYYGDTNFAEPGEVMLLNTNGTEVHRWDTKYTTLISYLQPNGHLYAAMTPPLDMNDYPSGGSTGLIQELDWKGDVLWEYEDHRMTHDFEVMPDGGVAYIRWHLASPSFTSGVRGGMRLATTSIWTNEIVVVNREKEVTWTWRPDDHLDPQEFELGPMIPRNDWFHANSIRYIERNPLTNTPAFLISARNISTILLIEYATGSVIWQSKGNILSLQHDATFTPNGSILVFDNGFMRNIPKTILISGAGEVDPHTNTITWVYSNGSSFLEKAQLASSIMGGAQRLENGNTLLTVSMANTLLEVTPEKEVAWRFTSDFRDDEGRMRVIFKARKYSGAGTEWLEWLPRRHFREQFCPIR